MSVDLPAPFSPTTAWTVPRATRMSTSRFATTPGKRFVMPRSSTAGAGTSLAMAGLLEREPGAGTGGRGVGRGAGVGWATDGSGPDATASGPDHPVLRGSYRPRVVDQ